MSDAATWPLNHWIQAWQADPRQRKKALLFEALGLLQAKELRARPGAAARQRAQSDLSHRAFVDGLETALLAQNHCPK